MGASREKKLREAAIEAKKIAEHEFQMHRETIAMLDMLRQASRAMSDRMKWYESCLDEYKRLKKEGVIADPF